ncbi:hypothetical protein BDP27DRAFT_1326417 [Rhodocollybia butyracea]|uniref:UDP-Glycosyltransferase/glycogen phosphorylase n=1 Tax=Rhodocollybia butyracea TaxID=206335 RepID=A0A9P5PT12_9AGAR|nr:hypothetical protein BDP27DRAFT_1326417 [Rhodocollybia butyracea]
MTPTKNIVAHCLSVWGHHKPLAALGVIITRSYPDVTITIITTGLIYPKFVDELKSKLSTEEYEQLSPRFNVIDVAGPEVNPFVPLQEFAPAFIALCNSEPIVCKSSGKVFSGIPPPTVALVDPFTPYAFECVRATKVPVIAWVTAPCGPLLKIFGPASLGGMSDPILETEAGRAAARARVLAPPDEQTNPAPDAEVVVASSDYVKSEVPGSPPMYDHEYNPQINLLPQGMLEQFGQIYIREADGIISVSNSVYEKEAVDAARAWVAGNGQTFYTLAPLSLPKPKRLPEADGKVVQFLDAMKEKFGPKSLIYISFGTYFWPPEQPKLIALLETLIANQTPFILSHASPLAQLSADFLASIKASGIGLASPWSPQETILQHEATGYFITHGGWNSIQESFEHKVPLIFWPMGADQPINAAVLGITHKAAFELIEVRSGENGTKPLLRFENTDYKPTFTVEAVKTEVEQLLVKIKGEEGRVVRANFEKLADEMARNWDDGKESRIDLNEFFKKYVN